MKWLLENWEMILSGLFAILVLVLAGKKLAYWRWLNEVSWFAWVQAEKEGLAQGLKGYDKLRIYMETWRQKYLEKWGSEPAESQVKAAQVKAAELSAKEKVIRLASPN